MYLKNRVDRNFVSTDWFQKTSLATVTKASLLSWGLDRPQLFELVLSGLTKLFGIYRKSLIIYVWDPQTTSSRWDDCWLLQSEKFAWDDISELWMVFVTNLKSFHNY